MRIPTRSALIGLVLASAVSGAMAPSAVAKDFYTRKRVNGRWIYGEFPKAGSQAEPDQAAREAVAQPAAPAAPVTPAAASYGLGLHFPPRIQTPSPAQTADQVAPAENVHATTGSVRHGRRHAARPDKRIAPQAKVRETAREADAAPDPRKPERAKPEESRAPAGRDAASPADKAQFTSLPGEAEKPAEPADPARRLAQALAAKAAALASGLIASAADPIPQPKAEPVSVNYDYKKGIKTVTYANGAIDEEPFDPATMKALATTPRTAATR